MSFAKILAKNSSDPVNKTNIHPQFLCRLIRRCSSGHSLCNNSLLTKFSPNFLEGINIVLDCAYGATITCASEIFEALGAKIIMLHDKPDGKNINKESGSQYPQKLQDSVITSKAHIGFAFDGLPIYGPFGFTNPLHNQGGIKVMTPSYRVKKQLRANNTIPDGTYIEDFEYVKNLGDLDEYNSRFCITPEYPDGIQAYFVTIDPSRPLYPLYPQNPPLIL